MPRDSFQAGSKRYVVSTSPWRPGKRSFFIGESGCGKTTLLRMFNRLEEPTEGTILIGGRPAIDGGLREALRRSLRARRRVVEAAGIEPASLVF